MKNTKNKMVSLFMATLMILSSFAINMSMTVPVLAAEPRGLGDVTVKEIQSGEALVKFKGVSSYDFAFSYTVYTKDGKQWPAYCINPNKPGVDQVGGSYVVDASSLYDNPQVYGAVINGFPFKTPIQMGVDTDYEAFYVTNVKLA